MQGFITPYTKSLNELNRKKLNEFKGKIVQLTMESRNSSDVLIFDALGKGLIGRPLIYDLIHEKINAVTPFIYTPITEAEKAGQIAKQEKLLMLVLDTVILNIQPKFGIEKHYVEVMTLHKTFKRKFFMEVKYLELQTGKSHSQDFCEAALDSLKCRRNTF